MENVYLCNNERQKEHLKPCSKTKTREREISFKGVWGLRNTCRTNVSNNIHLPPTNYMFV